MHETAWSLLPFLIVIPFAMITRQVLPGLLAGLLVGSYMLHPSVMGGLDASLRYIIQEVGIADNIRLVVFLYGFGAFVGLVRVTGGVAGFAEWVSSRIKTVRTAFAVTWLSSVATFMAPDFRIITVAPVMKKVFQRLGVPPERVALAIDVTSTPLCAVIPIGTAFVGYMVGLIASSNRQHGVAATPFHTFLLSIPFNFFSWLMLAYAVYWTFWRKTNVELPRSTAQARPVPITAESRLRLTPQFANAEIAGELTPALPRHDRSLARDIAQKEDDIPDPVEWMSEQVTPSLANLVLPLALLLGLTLYLTWWDGHQVARSFWSALANANAAKAMLDALFITLVASLVWYKIRKQSVSRIMFGFLAGGNEMMGVIVLLILVWAVSAVSTDLGFSIYAERAIGHLVPVSFMAPVLFVFGTLISYVIGSSFGTWGMLLPLGYTLAEQSHASVALIVGAVFASGTIGGFISPLSDNTVAMATVMKLPLMSYARQKLRMALPVVIVCVGLYAVAGWLIPA